MSDPEADTGWVVADREDDGVYESLAELERLEAELDAGGHAAWMDELESPGDLHDGETAEAAGRGPRCYVTFTGGPTSVPSELGSKRSTGQVAGIEFRYAVAAGHDAGGTRASRPRHDPVTVIKRPGAASPMLLAALVSHARYQSVLFEFERAEGRGKPFVHETIELTGATVVSMKRSLEREEISFAFERIEITNTAAGTSASDGWSSSRHEAFGADELSSDAEELRGDDEELFLEDQLLGDDEVHGAAELDVEPWREDPAGSTGPSFETTVLDRLSPETLDDDFLEEVTAAPTLPPAPAAGGTAARGKWIVLVAGVDYERHGVSFEQIARNRIKTLVRRYLAALPAARRSPTIDTAPRFVLFDVGSGRVRKLEVTRPGGTWQWSDLASFQPVTAANYTVHPGGRRVFDIDPAGRMSVTDVYRHVQELGRSEPGSLTELSFLSHGWVEGPILVNSDDRSGSPTERDPRDLDPRAFKDFSPPTMTPAALTDFRAAFDGAGFVWVWGCAFGEESRQVLHRVLTSRKYVTTRRGGLVDSDTFTLEFSRKQAEFFFTADRAFFPGRAANGEFPLKFTRTFRQIKDFFLGRLRATYSQQVALAATVPCFGALPGTYSDYEKNARYPVMVVPTQKPPYDDSFSPSINFYRTYLAVNLDPEGRGYGRYEP